MTQTGWIVVAVIAVAAIILVAMLLRRKPTDALPVEAQTQAPAAERVAPAAPAASPVQPAPIPPQTIAAEETPPAPAV
ncbi:MAG: hypothetical protein ABW169_16930, partial [Sphingobium sp.]